MSVEIKSINSKELWILQTASKPGDLADFYEWQTRFELHIRMDPAMVNIEIAGEISGKPRMALEKPRLIDVRNEVKEKYKDLRVEQAGSSKPKGRESPSTIAMEFDSETQKIIDQESTEEWKMQLRSIDDRIKFFKIHRLRICALALKYVDPHIGSIVKAKLPNHLECEDIERFMNAVLVGYNGATISVKTSIKMLQTARAIFRMQAEETLSQAKQRFIQSIRVPMSNLGMTAMTPEEEATAFLDSLPEAYEPLRKRIEEDETKLSAIPIGHPARENARIFFSIPQTIEEAYERAIKEKIIVCTKKTAFTTDVEKSIPEIDGKRKEKKSFKSKLEGPPPGPCWFCGELHWVQKCPTALAASKAQREKTGKKEYSRDADLAAKAAKRAELDNEKKTTLDLNKKEVNTTVADDEWIGKLCEMMIENPDLYPGVESEIHSVSKGDIWMRVDNNANTNVSPHSDEECELVPSPMRINCAMGAFTIEKGFQSRFLGFFQLNPKSSDYILSQQLLNRLFPHAAVNGDGEMDYHVEGPDGVKYVLEARFNEAMCLGAYVPSWLFNPRHAVAHATTYQATQESPEHGPFRHDINRSASIFSTQSCLTKGELEEAKMLTAREKAIEMLARRGQAAAGWLSDADMVTLAGNGSIINLPFNPNILRSIKLKRAEILRGKGKMKQGSTLSRVENSPIPDPEKKAVSVIIRGDLMWDNGQGWLIAKTEPGNKVYSQELGWSKDGAKSAVNLLEPFNKLVAEVRSDGQSPYELVYDCEGGIGANKESINNSQVKLRQLPKGSHDGPLNNVIMRVKDRMRTYQEFVKTKMSICRMMINFFLILAIFSINISPTSANPGGISAYRAVTGHQLDFNLIGKGVIGDIVEAKAHVGAGSNRTDISRSITAVILGMDVNCHGSYWMMNVETGRPFRRADWDKVETTPEILKKIDIIASRSTMPKNIRDTSDDNGIRTFNKKGNTLTQAQQKAIAKEEEYALFEGDVDHEEAILFDEKGNRIAAPGETTPERVKRSGEGVEPEGVEPPPLIERKPEYVKANEEISKFVLEDYHTVNFLHSVWSTTPATEVTRIEYSALKTGEIWSSQLSTRAAIGAFGKEQTTQSLIKEIDGMLKMKVFHGVAKSSLSITQIKKIIRCSTFYKEKLKDGVRASIKARLVADGSHQDPSIYDYEKDISAPTVATSSVFTILANAAAKNHHVITFDIGMAYLNATMESDVFMYLDPLSTAIAMQRDPTLKQYILDDGRIIVKLDKALYGCIESARRWYDTLKDVLIKRGYTVNPIDVCVFSKPSSSGEMTNVCFHVDDGLATSPDKDEIEALAAAMNSAFTEVKYNQGPVQEYLGMKLDFTKPLTVLLTMEKYIRDFTSELFPDLDASRAKSPADENLFEVDALSVKLTEVERKHFHRGVAQALYLGTRVRPDILVTVIFLTTRVGVATHEDLEKLKRLVRYLMGTSSLGLNLGGNENGEVQVIVYPDASYGVHANGRSHSGIYITLGRGAILAKSSSQHLVTKSSCEAELVTLSDSASLGMYLKNFMHEAGMGDAPGVFREDNMSTIRMAKNGRSTSDRTKHINIRYYFVKQFLDNGEFTIEHCDTENQIADILTKPLQGAHFERLRDLLLGYSLP